MITYIVSFAIVLGVLIFAHEFGHFIVAKALGVGVEKFSLGFGPKILGKKVGMTDYRISAVPLGGYVKMVGEAPDSELDPSQIPLSFSHKSLWKRSLIVLAGPVFNLLLSVAIFFAFLLISGLPIIEPEVGGVQEGMPAAQAGVQTGDYIAAVDGAPVAQWDEMAGIIKQSKGRPLTFELLRKGEVVSVQIVPRLVPSQNLFGETIDKYVIGITPSGAYTIERLNPVEALTRGVAETWQIAKVTVLVIGKIVTGRVSAKKAIGGPIMIAQIAGEQAKAGITSLIGFIAALSVTLGVINLLPIPVLDGGHLLFFAIEAISRRPVNLKMREVAQQVGLFLLVLIMIYVIYNDISRILFD
ncbi:MAG: RIP metalloprotease RseP [Thermodesulfobacteriota bacterium]|nr:RIP metalloprotease RseP [Thermodesulfobacteriota bacterium]